jgi:inner membrane protein
MDNLTHGLIGFAIGSFHRVRSKGGQVADVKDLTWRDRAGLIACVIAAELPDLDVFVRAENEVLQSLHAHRGLSHSLVLTPAWALLATAIAHLVTWRWRGAPSAFLYAWASVLFGHVVPDLWTGWGVQLFQPWFGRHFSLDWMMVIDPIFTGMLLIGVVLELFWRRIRHLAAPVGLAIALTYVGARLFVKAGLEGVVREAHPTAEQIHVFPDWLGLSRWRFVTVESGGYRAGIVRIGSDLRDWGVRPYVELPPDVAAVPTVAAVTQWAQFPVNEVRVEPNGARIVRIGDLRYHLAGEPTLAMEMELAPDGGLRSAKLVRPKDPAALLKQWWSL